MNDDYGAAAAIAASRIGRAADACMRVVVENIEGSRVIAIVRDRVARFEALPAADRRTSAIVLIAAAMAAHLVMASLLPPSVRPIRALTAVALPGAILAAAAAIARTR